MSSPTVVLAYHAIGAAPRDADLYNAFVPVETFASQMAFLARHRRVVSLDSIDDQLSDDRPARVAITFDDAYETVLAHAVPILERYGFPATVFVPTKWIGDRNRWDAPADLPLGIMTAEELSGLSARGFEIASHGHAHIDLSRATTVEVQRDLAESIRLLAELNGEPPRHLAYPYGRSSEAARAAAAAAGFRGAFSLESEDGPFAQARVPVFPFDRGRLFAFKTSGRYLALRRSAVVMHSYDLVRPLVRRPRLWP